MLLPLSPLLLLELTKLLALFPFDVPRLQHPEHDPYDDCDGDELTHVYSYGETALT
jgi:hypothetical protein